MKFLIYGSTGFIGQQICKIIRENGHVVNHAKERLENLNLICNELDTIKPDRVICAAGLTGRPSIDWCEDHKEEVIKINIFGTVNLAIECFKRNIHFLNFATGCIYTYSDSKKIFSEEDIPNFDKSFYSKTKIMAEELQKNYNPLILRLRMPISDFENDRDFITKITRYEKVVNIQNSMTILSDLLPIAFDMSVKKITGIYNFTNPGTISHNEILELYKIYINPNFVINNFTLEEQSKVIKVDRSNNELDVSKLLKMYTVKPIRQSIVDLFIRRASKSNH